MGEDAAQRCVDHGQREAVAFRSVVQRASVVEQLVGSRGDAEASADQEVPFAGGARPIPVARSAHVATHARCRVKLHRIAC